MFKFIHGYLPKLWEAQVKSGLIKDGDGIRFCQNIMLKDELKFNVLALVIVCFALSVMLMNIVVHNSTGVMPFAMKNYLHVGLISGLLDSFIYLGSGIATYTLGVLSENHGWNGVFTVIVIVSLVIGVIGFIGGFIKPKTKPILLED